LAEALGEAAQGDLATKADLVATKSELITEIAESRTELKTEIAGTKTDLLKWIIGAISFQTVVILVRPGFREVNSARSPPGRHKTAQARYLPRPVIFRKTVRRSCLAPRAA
jgi:hypothetical protein